MSPPVFISLVTTPDFLALRMFFRKYLVKFSNIFSSPGKRFIKNDGYSHGLKNPESAGEYF